MIIYGRKSRPQDTKEWHSVFFLWPRLWPCDQVAFCWGSGCEQRWHSPAYMDWGCNGWWEYRRARPDLAYQAAIKAHVKRIKGKKKPGRCNDN